MNPIRSSRHTMTGVDVVGGGFDEYGRCDDSVSTDLPASGFSGAESGVTYASDRLHFYCVSYTCVPWWPSLFNNERIRTEEFSRDIIGRWRCDPSLVSHLVPRNQLTLISAP